MWKGSLGQLLGGVPGLQFNPMMLLHGEQYVKLLKPIPTEGAKFGLAAMHDAVQGCSPRRPSWSTCWTRARALS